MRWFLWATVVAAYAAELRLETFVTVELTLDNLPLRRRAPPQSLDARGGAAISHFQHRAGVVCVNCSLYGSFLSAHAWPPLDRASVDRH